MSIARHVADLDEQGRDGLPIGKIILALALLCMFAGAVWWVVKSMKAETGGAKRQVVKIAVLPEAPPPPPPPPKEEKKIEPEKKALQPQPQQEQPKPQETPPEPQQLKMEGPAGDGPSSFSSGEIKSDYKGGEIGTGTGGVNKMQFALFTNRLTRHIQSELARIKELKGVDYKVNVRIWLGADGSFQRIEFMSSSGDEAQTAQLNKAMSQIAPIDQVPGNLPQPLTLRITNRVTG